MTYDERFTQIEGKVDELLEIVKPKETKTEADPNQMLMDEIVAISNEMDLLIDEVKSVRQDVQIALEQPFELTEEVSEADEKFNKRRNIFVLASLLVTGALSLIFWFNFLPLFAICFGVFFGFGFQALVLVFDEFTLQGNSLKRISKNAIACAIYLLIAAFSIWNGIQVGTSLISDRSPVEEYRPPTTIERQHTETRTEPQSEPNIGESEE
jgi:Mg2+/citrate symporter